MNFHFSETKIRNIIKFQCVSGNLMYFFQCIMLVILATNVSFAAKKPINSTSSTNASLCADTPIPEPVTQFESLPEHVKLMKNVTGYNQPNRATCQSEKFKYDAVKDNERVKVVSHYKKGGRLHAEYFAVKNAKISGNYLKHGILSTFWPDGKKQAIEFYCDGFAVGFHQYFNKNGKLAYVVDYTHSDYEWQKRIGVGNFREFYQSTSH